MRQAKQSNKEQVDERFKESLARRTKATRTP